MTELDHPGYWHLPIVVFGATLAAWPMVGYALARAYRRMEARHRAAWATPNFREEVVASYRRAAFLHHVKAPWVVRATAAFRFRPRLPLRAARDIHPDMGVRRG
ncbi:MAG: hypothetical protein QOI41_7065, partial [Myxococcales bacterium]|nr:hypothetical protein [Myxococcales bacterium]